MTLLNGLAMFAAIAVIVPILVHLRKRRKSKVIDWPAMQFLKQTVTRRRRGVTLENLLLLLLRCLLVLLFVLAMARPAIESGRQASWLIFFLFVGIGLLSLTLAIVSNWQRISRVACVVLAAVFFGVAGGTLSLTPHALVDSQVDRDIVLVVDHSLTMTLGDDTSHFDKAIAQARTLVGTLAGNSTVSIVLAGPIAETVDGSPFRNLRNADQILGTLTPVAGGSNLESALQQARSLLKRTPNSRKQVLLLTDNQLCAWETMDLSTPTTQRADTDIASSRSPSDAEVSDTSRQSAGIKQPVKHLEVPVEYAAIVSNLPKKITNLSVDRLEIQSSLVATRRPVPMEVEIHNGGSTTVRDATVKLLVDGIETASDSLVQLEPGARSTVRFLHRFSKSGQHVVSGLIEVSDELSEDNQFDTVVDVIQNLSVLIVNGSTDADPALQSATFAQLALDPSGLRQLPNGDAPEKEDSHRAIAAAELEEMESLNDFHLVMLCDVPRLPDVAAERLAGYVENGGGLWVLPGEHADRSFYNHWQVPLNGQPFMPATLEERTQWPGKSEPEGRVIRLGVALDVSGRPFISDLLERGGHDLADVAFTQFWSMKASEQAIVDMRLTNGEILFAEQAIGRGRVLMQSVSFARSDSNFPATLGFPVLLHLLTYHLATSYDMPPSIDPTADLVTSLNAKQVPTTDLGTLQLCEPKGTKRQVPVSWQDDAPFARVGRAVVPGVYRLNHGNGPPVASFAVHRTPGESDLSAVSSDRLSEISRELGIHLIDDVSQLAAPAASESAAAEIWNLLLFTVLWLLAAECLITNWIRNRRRVTEIPTSLTIGSGSPLVPLPTLEPASSGPRRWDAVLVNDSIATSVSGGRR